MHRRIALVSGALLTALVSGCVTTALTPTAAAPLASKALGREALLIWVEAAESALARAMVQAVLPDNAQRRRHCSGLGCGRDRRNT